MNGTDIPPVLWCRRRRPTPLPLLFTLFCCLYFVGGASLPTSGLGPKTRMVFGTRPRPKESHDPVTKEEEEQKFKKKIKTTVKIVLRLGVVARWRSSTFVPTRRPRHRVNRKRICLLEVVSTLIRPDINSYTGNSIASTNFYRTTYLETIITTLGFDFTVMYL